MTRDEAYNLLSQHIVNQNLIKHMLATEAVMRALCKRLLQNPSVQVLDNWGLVGLLHDLDYEMAKEAPEKHGLISKDLLTGKISEPQIYAIMAHNSKYTKVEPKSALDWSIACCDELTGLIVASALIHPDKKLSSINAEFVMKRFREKNFAKGANRKSIERCKEKLGIELEEFIEINLEAMQEIAPILGL
ncbi:MAG: hypothetical protein A2798_02715 [Candidatus Levybacteria bacterium RIFCSPHIGHO2_01_FULL_37_17]|nr:MAG: hypothetical protein A2798_02715 [Candidatus Levybacteria bacterium RIFCSPHIGHO2_01_FULL_37_17]OGH36768.1 MAG: hypothetical protein A2959_00705 [Candidatus Levybacteria bacterium RIFCSPLOWO2_01_FULL_38_23]